MHDSLLSALVLLLAFGAVVLVVYVIGQYVATQVQTQQRIMAPAGDQSAAPDAKSGLDALIATHIDEKKFGVDGTVRAKLKRELIGAGFFHNDAVKYYILARFAAVIIVPTAAYLVMEFFTVVPQWTMKFGILAIFLLVAVFGPDAYIARRQRRLREQYRCIFPDMLDLMVVCVDAGLSLDAAIDRISGEIIRESRELGTNLCLLSAETRAGRSTVDALASFAERIGLDEARSFSAMLRQSIDLGTDVAEALRVFSDEMRQRRMFRAEERANKLPVKMVLPLGLFIFPVILMIAMVPTAIRLMSVLK
jgi:tight adherence protein C